jgi:hypothetical protein
MTQGATSMSRLARSSGVRSMAFPRTALRLPALLFLVLSATALAETQTYKGLMIPNTVDAPISISIVVERSAGKLKGRFTSSAPLTGDGVFMATIKNLHQCDFTTNIGAGRTLVFDGYCLTNTIEGPYVLRFPDGTTRNGHFHLKREDPVKAKREQGPGELSTPPLSTSSACITANSACLAACPRGDYNAEFMCSTRCRQRLASCKAKASGTSASPP